MIRKISPRAVAVLSSIILVPSAAVASEVIEEIIVTADYRGRSSIKLPASITVFESDQIRKLAVQHFEELINVIPNVNWSGDGHRAKYFQIRGVGELEQYEGAPNPSVGLLIDDIDFSGIGTVATLFDMQQIEILRGPQASRFGANALAGLIYMQSTAPTAAWGGRVQMQLGDDDAISTALAIGGPLSSDESLMFRVSANHHQSDGYRDNPYLNRHDTNGREETTIRGKVLWQPDGGWSINFSGVYANIDNGYDAFAIDNSYTMLSDKPGKDAQRSVGASLRVEWPVMHRARLTTITSVADSEIDFSYDADWGNDDSWAPVTYDYVSMNDRGRTAFSQEIRLASTDSGRIFADTTQWLLGVYALNLEEGLLTVNTGDYYDPFYDFADSLHDELGSEYDATNVALFGQLDRAISDATRISLGLRIERRATDYIDTAGLRADPSETMSGGELSLSHDHSDALTSFVSLSKGYKAGGFNLGFVPDGRREFGAERLWNVEAGIKSTWLDTSLIVNASMFFNRRDNQQVRTSFQLLPGDPASFVFFTDNAARGETIGIEADLRWLPKESWEFYASIGLLNAEFDEFQTPQVDLSGRAQAHAPGYTLAAGASYRRSSGIFARIDVSARDEFYFDVSHDQESKPHELVNARLGYEDDVWSAQLWVRNLFDRRYAVRGFFFGNEPPDFPSTLYTRLGDPRQVGVTIERKF